METASQENAFLNHHARDRPGPSGSARKRGTGVVDIRPWGVQIQPQLEGGNVDPSAREQTNRKGER